jgi:hypothetical protein
LNFEEDIGKDISDVTCTDVRSEREESSEEEQDDDSDNEM